MTHSSDWDDLWEYLSKVPARRAMVDVQLPPWDPGDTGIEPLTGRDSGAYHAAMSDSDQMTMTRLLPASDTRPADQHCNYRGKVDPPTGLGPAGPNTIGENMWPVTYGYDERTDRSRVGYSYRAPDWGKILDDDE